MPRLKVFTPTKFQHRGIWYLNVYDQSVTPPKRQKLSTGLTDEVQAEAKRQEKQDELARERQAQAVEGIATRLGFTRTATQKQTQVLVGQCLDLIQADYVRQGNRSWSTMQYHVKRAREMWGAERALDLTVASVEAGVDEWLGEDVRPATINNRLAMLFHGLALAVPKLLPRMPDCRLEPLDPANIKQGFFEYSEYQRLRATLPDDDLRDVLDWLYCAGWRIGEVRAVTWTALDREAWELRLSGKDSKSKKGRIVPVGDLLRPILQRRIKARVVGCPFIFHRNGEKLGDFDKAWATAWRAASLELVTRRVRPRTPEERATPRMVEGPELTPHDLRRTAARNMMRAGWSRKLAKQVTGHSTDSIFDRYDITETDDLVQGFTRLKAYHQHLATAAAGG